MIVGSSVPRWYIGGAGPEKVIYIIVSAPVELGNEFHLPDRLAPYRCKHPAGIIILVGICSGIECVGAISLLIYSCLDVDG